MVLHTIIIGFILGWGVAMPLGPINSEIIRRNLQFGMRYGMALGIGATTADLCYLILLTTGVIQLLNHPMLLRIVGIMGSVILCWFAYKIFTAHIKQSQQVLKPKTIWHSVSSGFIVAFLSPFNLLFWASLTSQVTAITQGVSQNIILVGLGIILGAMGWVTTLNSILHITRHKLTNKMIKLLNNLGGLVLLGFAIYGLIHAVS